MKVNAWKRPLQVALALGLLAALAGTALAQANVYDKFRDKTHSNKGYLTEEEEIKLGGQDANVSVSKVAAVPSTCVIQKGSIDTSGER